jgi:hypothetical protein
MAVPFASSHKCNPASKSWWFTASSFNTAGFSFLYTACSLFLSFYITFYHSFYFSPYVFIFFNICIFLFAISFLIVLFYLLKVLREKLSMGTTKTKNSVSNDQGSGTCEDRNQKADSQLKPSMLNNTQVFFLNTILVRFSWYVILYFFIFFVPVFPPFSTQVQYSHENVQVEGTNATEDPESGSKGSVICKVSSFFLLFYHF